jgi:hypothetical protein
MKGEIMNTKTTNTMRPSLKLALLAPLALIGLSATPNARADTLLLAQTSLVSGTVATDDSFTTPGAGVVNVSLQNLGWPTQLSALSFSATSANQVLASWTGSGSNITGGAVTFDVGAGTYFAHVMATAGGSLNLGLYSMIMTFTPSVPLPASGWMLLTGMFVLAGLARAVRPLELTTGTAAA